MDHSLVVACGIQIGCVLGRLAPAVKAVVCLILFHLSSFCCKKSFKLLVLLLPFSCFADSLRLQPFDTQLAIDRFQFKDANYWIGLGILYNLAAYAVVLLLSSVSLHSLLSVQM